MTGIITKKDWIGKTITVMKNCCQHYTGEVIVKKQLKGGEYLCITPEGKETRVTLTEIRRHNDECIKNDQG